MSIFDSNAHVGIITVLSTEMYFILFKFFVCVKVRLRNMILSKIGAPVQQHGFFIVIKVREV